MNPCLSNPCARRAAAFTLVEILTAVAITTIIVFTLVKMFDTSTKALQVANRQTDVWESARATFGILRENLGEVTTTESNARINLFSANGLPRVSFNILGNLEPMLLQDLYILARENNQWVANVYLLRRDRPLDSDDGAVMTLYRFQTNFPVHTSSGGPFLDIEIASPPPPRDIFPGLMLAADRELDAFMDDIANGKPVRNSISVMSRGIVHLMIAPYAADGRKFTNSFELNRLPNDHFFANPDRVRFQGDTLPASVDLEMFVLHPDRIEEFRAQSGDIARRLYLDRHVNSIQLFRTRIPIRRDLLARQ